MSISDFLELLGLSEESSTANPTPSAAGRWSASALPRGGGQLPLRDLEVTVLAMDGLRVDRVLVKRSGPEPGETEEN